MTAFEYWKKMYMLYGDEFLHEIWYNMIDKDWGNVINASDSLWCDADPIENQNYAYVLSLDRDGKTIMKFTDKFFMEMENEEN